jgi:hypothetical protein
VYRQSASQVAEYPVRKDVERKARKDEKVWSRARKGIGAPVFVRVVQRHEEGTYVTICRSGLALVEEVEQEKVAKIERSMLRGAVGDIRGAELELPRRGRRRLGVGGRWEDKAGLSADGPPTLHG